MKAKLGISVLFIFFIHILNCWSKGHNILDYGAVGDGTTLCTEAIQSAIDACSDSGGGRVLIPAGEYLSGTILLKSNVEIHFEHSSTLLGSPNKDDYPLQPVPQYRSLRDNAGFRSLIYAEGVSNIALTGSGTIDGQGKYHTRIKGQDDDRPRNLMFISCRNIRVEGLHLTNSGFWNQHYLNCEDVIVHDVSVYNHCNYNNDAIDIDGCRRVVLSDSFFDTDDDGITLKSTGAAATEDVTITNCVVSSFCNAIKAGTESTGGFRNISISNCVIKPSRSQTEPLFKTPLRGITGISLEIVDGGVMEGITISNITIEGTECPLYIRLANRARKHINTAPVPSPGVMRNINIDNITAYNTGNYSSSITGILGCFVENISINNIQLFNKGGLKEGEYIASIDSVKEDEKGYPQPTVWKNLPSSVLFIRHVKNLNISNLMFGSNEPDPRIPVVVSDAENIRIGESIFTGSSAPSVPFILLDKVEGYDIKKILNWEDGKLIQSTESEQSYNRDWQPSK